MGVQKLAKSGKTEMKATKVETLESEITMSMPPSRKIVREEALPSPFDSMYMSPRLDIKGHTPITNVYGEMLPKKKKDEII